MFLSTAAIRSEISIQTVRFDGSPSFTEDGEEFVPDHPGKLRYVGEPSSEVIFFSRRKKPIMHGDQSMKSFGMNIGAVIWPGRPSSESIDFLVLNRHSLDVFHTLHCLVSDWSMMAAGNTRTDMLIGPSSTSILSRLLSANNSARQTA